MWASIAKWLGVELIKQLVQLAKDAFYKYLEEKKQKEREASRAKRESLLIEIEVARQNGDIAAIDRLSTELGKLPTD